VEAAAEAVNDRPSELNEVNEVIEAVDAKDDVEMKDQSESKEVAQFEEPVAESIITLKPYRDPSNSK